MMQAIRVLVIEDHPIVMAGCLRLLEGRAETTVYTAASGADGVKLNAQHQPDAAILDLNLPDGSGLDVLGALLRDHPPLRVLIFSSYEDPAFAARALDAGAAGYVIKSDDPEILVEALEYVLKGDVYLSRSMAQRLAMMNVRPSNNPLQGLSPRQLEILRYLSQGLNLYEISQELDVGYRTIASISAGLRRRLGNISMVALVKFAVDNLPKK